LQDAINSGKVSEEDANKWIESLSKQYETSQGHLDSLRETLSNIEELEAEGKEAYTELRDMAKEAILNSLQEQIDLQQDTLDATRDANS
jgi:polyhydroxyalkanoate synthesis regulator phasin